VTGVASDEDLVRAWFRGAVKGDGTGTFRPSGLCVRIAKESGASSALAVGKCMRRMEANGELTCLGWVVGNQPRGNVSVDLGPACVNDDEASWREAVLDRVSGDDSARDGFFSIWQNVRDWPMETRRMLIDELLSLRGAAPGTPVYLASAAGRLGSSKLVSALPSPALRAIGVPIDALVQAPMCFLVAGHSDPEAVVLVENPIAFERAIAATRNLPVCWISVHGFAGLQLGRTDEFELGSSFDGAASAVRLGSPPPLSLLLDHGNLLHWGDLDIAGLRIFEAMMGRFPHLRLSALYKPMADLLRSGGGHPYVKATGKAGQASMPAIRWKTKQLEGLAALCACRSVDQEYVSTESMGGLCLGALDAAKGGDDGCAIWRQPLLQAPDQERGGVHQ
jgi:hypothetical protein